MFVASASCLEPYVEGRNEDDEEQWGEGFFLYGASTQVDAGSLFLVVGKEGGCPLIDTFTMAYVGNPMSYMMNMSLSRSTILNAYLKSKKAA